MILAIARSDGGVTMLTILGPHDAAAEVAKWQSTSAATAVSWRVVEASEVPVSRRFRSAWVETGTLLRLDMTKARNQRMAEIRADRNGRLTASDAAYLRAQDVAPATVAAWKSYRQALRDLPTTVQSQVDAVPDAEALATYEPTWPASP